MIARIKKRRKGIAVALVVLLCFSAVYYFSLGAQIYYQSDSPLIPSKWRNTQVHPILVRGAIFGLLGVSGVILFFYKRYYLIIAITVLALVGDALI